MSNSFGIPTAAVGFRLCVLRRIKGGEERLDLSEKIRFTDGYSALDTILRRARICGDVGEFGTSIRDDQNHWLDILDTNGDLMDVLPVGREPWNYLKRKTKARIERIQ